MINLVSKVFDVLILAAVTAIASTAAQNTNSGKNQSVLAGDWRGVSVCVVRQSACRDEDSLYHITQDPAKTAGFLIKGDKIVDGKAVTMGTVSCGYDAKARTLECAMPPDGGVTRFLVEGNEMHGTMTLADKTEWRKITLKKVRAESAC